MIKLNDQQREAVDTQHEFAEGPEPFFLLDGWAGTGKSTCEQTFVRETSRKVAMTAPTNKATKVLREMAATELEASVDTATIYSLLGLRLDNSGEVRTVSAHEGGNRAGDYDIVVVDEASMVNSSLFGHICRTAQEEGVKFVFMGDAAQLPPVGEVESEAMKVRYRRNLTKVERHDNQILTLVTQIRNCQHNGESPILRTDNDENGGVYALNWKAMRRRACEAFTSDSYLADPGSIKVIAWRNATVNMYNELIRQAVYGDKVAAEGKFQLGERIVACQPITLEGALQMATDEEGTIEEISIEPHPVYRHLTCYKLMIDPEFGTGWVPAYVIHESSEREHKRLLADLADAAKARRGSWAAFWDVHEAIHDIRPCYAITAHRSQGSTYESVFVDAGDILSNRTRLEALQCLYVACSRPRRILATC